MEFKGTKGEWYYDGFVNGIKCDSVDGLLATVWGTYNSSEHEIREDGESWLSMRKRTEPIRSKCSEEQIANAKLIAAAPDLLEALQILVGDIEHSPKPFTKVDKINIARKAIEKALK